MYILICYYRETDQYWKMDYEESTILNNDYLKDMKLNTIDLCFEEIDFCLRNKKYGKFDFTIFECSEFYFIFRFEATKHTEYIGKNKISYWKIYREYREIEDHDENEKYEIKDNYINEKLKTINKDYHDEHNEKRLELKKIKEKELDKKLEEFNKLKEELIREGKIKNA